MSQVELTTLGESCEFFNGKAHEKDIDVDGKYIVVNSKFISQEGRVIKRTKEQMFPLYKGDIVMVMSDVPNGKALAKCFIIDQDETYSLNQRICCIRSKEFDTKYLYYQLNRHEHLLAFNNGENQTNLRKADILDCPIIKPSLTRQKQVVIEIEKSLNQINTAHANISQNLINSESLFQSYLLESFGEVADSEKYDNWQVKELGEIASFSQGIQVGLAKHLKEPREGYVRFVRIVDYTQETKDIRYIPDPGKKYFVNENDIVMVRYGTPGLIGRGKAGVIANNLFKITITIPDLSNDFLTFYLSQEHIQNYLSSQGAVAMPALNFGHLKTVLVKFPAISEQNRIVNELNLLRAETKKLESFYEKKLNSVVELKNNVLRRAFENEVIEAE